MQTVQLNVSDEFVAFGTAINGLIADIKAGKTAVQDVEDAFASLVGALGALDKIAVDIKAPSNQAYLLLQILTAVEPVQAAT
jgi:hypothetical protein